MPNYQIILTGSSKAALSSQMLADLVAGTAKAVHLNIENITCAEVTSTFSRKFRVRKPTGTQEKGVSLP